MAETYEKLIKDILGNNSTWDTPSLDKCAKELEELFAKGLSKRNAELGISEVKQVAYNMGYQAGLASHP